MLVFTGEMSLPRPAWEKRVEAAGLAPRSAATNKVKLVVAADPDSLSGKASKTADSSIPMWSRRKHPPQYCRERDTPERDE